MAGQVASHQQGKILSNIYGTGWPFRLCQTSRWHQNKSSVLVWGPCTKTQLMFWCQWEVWHNLNGHPAQILPCRHDVCPIIEGVSQWKGGEDWWQGHWSPVCCWEIWFEGLNSKNVCAMFLMVMNVQELKQMCEESLCTNINTDNVLGKISVLLVAHSNSSTHTSW